MAKRVIEASAAVAEGVKLCRPGVIPMYPITPQTHIVEKLADFIDDGKLDCRVIHAESEHSAISAALGAEATGVRTFTATASQGLALMHEMLFIVSGMRLPVVMAVANRTLSSPINIWNDQQDSIAERDSGWIQLYAEDAQEVFDTVIHSYKIAENKDVLLPVMVCLDGFILSHVYEPVDIPEQNDVDAFLPAYTPLYVLDSKNPITMGPIAFPDSFMHFKKQQQEAMEKSLDVITKVNQDFSRKFGRSYGDGLIETYKMEDAECAIAAMGSVCGTIRVVIDELRKKGRKVGLIKIRCYRPFPEDVLLKTVKCLKAVAIIDKDISLGYDGALYTDIKAALHNQKIILNNFIMGLGGKDITKDDIIKVFDSIKNENEQEWIV